MSIYKRGEVYWYKFMWQGKLLRESTKQGNERQGRPADGSGPSHIIGEGRSGDPREEAGANTVEFLLESHRTMG